MQRRQLHTPYKECLIVFIALLQSFHSKHEQLCCFTCYTHERCSNQFNSEIYYIYKTWYSNVTKRQQTRKLHTFLILMTYLKILPWAITLVFIYASLGRGQNEVRACLTRALLDIKYKTYIRNI